MHCYLDLDGVIVDLLAGAMARYGFKNPYDDPAMLGQWDFFAAVGIDNFWQGLDHNFWAGLPPTEDSDVIIEMVRREFGRNFSILTSPTSHPGCESGKRAWVARHLPHVSITCDARKHLYADCESLLIDDGDHNVDAFRWRGGHAILYPRLWNSRHADSGIALQVLSADLRRLR